MAVVSGKVTVLLERLAPSPSHYYSKTFPTTRKPRQLCRTKHPLQVLGNVFFVSTGTKQKMQAS